MPEFLTIAWVVVGAVTAILHMSQGQNFSHMDMVAFSAWLLAGAMFGPVYTLLWALRWALGSLQDAYEQSKADKEHKKYEDIIHKHKRMRGDD